MTAELADAILSGLLIPVMVFGTNECCEHGISADENPACHSSGYGICDQISTHAPGGSDCNRAYNFLLRPNDEAMNSVAVEAALLAVLSNDQASVHRAASS